MSNKNTAPKPATTEEKLQTVLGLATDTAKNEIAGAANRSVTAEATLKTSVTEGDDTDCNGVNAAVTLGVTSSKQVKGAAPAAAPAKKS
ncbi:MAG TPA: hypothetical protein PLC15_01115 [Candidatus Obscuribacter sp.]|nr:hypothetical protein [Candidatus Obscuribacter sp.]HMX44513.1 hypothetical protein [Candidatus Obscuribacter sp.]HMY52538.1 hypothetical protein [Candidatus Obscuribacter sp.]HNB13944.1 hypothetical protein [Candidatus Obscuribacter sp.]HND65323.1 hypothetical protein [Candidatus Obscuribacter sp.]